MIRQNCDSIFLFSDLRFEIFQFSELQFDNSKFVSSLYYHLIDIKIGSFTLAKGMLRYEKEAIEKYIFEIQHLQICIQR